MLIANADDPASEVAARLRAAGPPRLKSVQLWQQPPQELSVQAIKMLHAEWPIDLLILDPLNVYATYNLTLRALRALAEKTQMAIIGTVYPRKGGDISVKYDTVRTKINVDSGTLRRQDGETIDFKIVDAVTPSGATTAKVEWL